MALALEELEPEEAQERLEALYARIEAEILVAEKACDDYQAPEAAQELSLLGDFISVLQDMLPAEDEEDDPYY